MTLNCLNGRLYVKFSPLRTDFESYYLLIYCEIYLDTHVISGDVGSGVADRDPQNIWNPRKKLPIFRRRYHGNLSK